MADSEVDLTAQLDLDMSDAADQLREIADAFHRAADQIEEVEDGGDE